MAEKEYILFCDESERSGKFYSNFYGGVMVTASVYESATQALNQLKTELNLFGEVKWEKVTERYLDRYVRLIQGFFALMRQGGIRVRIMFRQNANEPTGLTPEHRDNEYFLLYYQFIKHGFQLADCPGQSVPPILRLYFDQFPDTKEKIATFRTHLLRQLGTVPFLVQPENIVEVRSHDHVLLQCLDIVMGSMVFRLNDKHKEKNPETGKRGKRTKAKEALYKVILKEIRTLHPGFNIGISTGEGQTWDKPYAHWNFIPRHREINPSRTKHGVKKENPNQPT